MGYTLEIFPNKARPPLGKEHREIRIRFKDQETKTAYVKAENLFTLDTFNEYLLADTKDKKATQRALDLKRVTFARQQNYYPKKGNKSIWEYDPSSGGDQPLRFA